MKRGKDIIIKKKINGKYSAIAGSTGCEIEKTGDVIETSSPTSGKAKKFIPGRTQWRTSLTYLVVDSESVFDNLLMVGDECELTFIGNNGLADQLVGKAICTSCHISAQVGSLVKGSIEFQGSEELENPYAPKPVP